MGAETIEKTGRLSKFVLTRSTEDENEHNRNTHKTHNRGFQVNRWVPVVAKFENHHSFLRGVISLPYGVNMCPLLKVLKKIVDVCNFYVLDGLKAPFYTSSIILSFWYICNGFLKGFLSFDKYRKHTWRPIYVYPWQCCLHFSRVVPVRCCPLCSNCRSKLST